MEKSIESILFLKQNVVVVLKDIVSSGWLLSFIPQLAKMTNCVFERSVIAVLVVCHLEKIFRLQFDIFEEHFFHDVFPTYWIIFEICKVGKKQLGCCFIIKWTQFNNIDFVLLVPYLRDCFFPDDDDDLQIWALRVEFLDKFLKHQCVIRVDPIGVIKGYHTKLKPFKEDIISTIVAEILIRIKTKCTYDLKNGSFLDLYVS